MILGDIFERFARDSPLSVMARGVIENALNPTLVDQLFEDVADKQYTKRLLFSSIVDLMSLVVCRIQPAVHAAYQAHAETLDATVQAVYGKLDRTEPALSAALVRATAARLAPVIDAMGGARPPLLPGYHVRILDGNHLAGTEHRIKELRTIGAGALPGHALVVLDPRLMLVTDVVLCEDGHAQERSLLVRILTLVRARDLWIDDRNFCTTNFLFGIAGREAFFVVRQHAATLHWEFAGKRRACGRIDTGAVFQQTIRATNDAGEILILRRVTLVLHKPTRDGDVEIHLLTNVPAKEAPAKVIAELYRKRWLIETAFAELEATLNGEINTLGYPKAALFGFCVALVAYNVLAVIRAALRSEHGRDEVEAKASNYHLVQEVATTCAGMMIAIPPREWEVFQRMSVQEMAEFLREAASQAWLARYPRSKHGPKKPRPKRTGRFSDHVATARLLDKRDRQK
jgi:IS4 transposase